MPTSKTVHKRSSGSVRIRSAGGCTPSSTSAENTSPDLRSFEEKASRRPRLQLELPILEKEGVRTAQPDAVVEVVLDDRGTRARVRPMEFTGWVRFPKRLRVPGAVYQVELLKPLPGGAWAATGKITKVRR